MLIIFNVHVNVQELRNVHLTLKYDVTKKKNNNRHLNTKQHPNRILKFLRRSFLTFQTILSIINLIGESLTSFEYRANQ